MLSESQVFQVYQITLSRCGSLYQVYQVYQVYQITLSRCGSLFQDVSLRVSGISCVPDKYLKFPASLAVALTRHRYLGLIPPPQAYPFPPVLAFRTLVLVPGKEREVQIEVLRSCFYPKTFTLEPTNILFTIAKQLSHCSQDFHRVAIVEYSFSEEEKGDVSSPCHDGRGLHAARM